ncbi:MAG: AbrB/MazE/SpoVT family DNA-binding domain-containing protein [Brevundimonas aurantiaca]|jgi:bifunctional DNA-binding transcriptional regulator/antitoxin component of YhaV-PrlF toxin-antitoxin module|uniref:AbrB/MazE/SpoVT family DNA-binding domain-containing protein n=1 Tax=Brevundimonas aurantiaca TaxID=74316 RepID=UPI00301918A5
MITLTVTSRGQVTFRKEVLQHLGIQPGEKIHLDLLPDGRAELRAEQTTGSWSDFSGLLKDRTNGAPLSIEEINVLTRQAGAHAPDS